MRRLTTGALALTLGVLAPGAAGAVPIVLSNPDITSGPVTGRAVVATDRPTQWVVPAGGGNWWAPSADQRFNNPFIPGTGDLPGDYVYDVTFDLTGFDPATAVLSGLWTTDNGGSVQLNGGPLSSIGPTVYGSTFAFNYNSGFLAGMNTLRFNVNNEHPGIQPWAGSLGENPTGVYIQYTMAQADPLQQVPEPGTLGLLGMALCGLGARRLRRG